MKKEIYQHSGYNKDNKNIARVLRKNLTPQEKHIWYDFLSKYRIRFFRQRTLDNYVLDFYCPRAKLAIEIDGSQHYTKEGKSYDLARTEIIEQHNIMVARFSNYDVNTSFEAVCKAIDNLVSKRLLELESER